MTGLDIKRMRESTGINQAKLANILGLTSRHTIADIENCKLQIKEDYILYIIGVLAGYRDDQHVNVNKEVIKKAS